MKLSYIQTGVSLLKVVNRLRPAKKSCVDNVTCRRTGAEESEFMFVSVFILQGSEYIKRC